MAPSWSRPRPSPSRLRAPSMRRGGATMRRDDTFEPKLGKIGSQDSRRGQRYLQQVLKAMALAGARTQAGSARFHGSRIGRGAGVGRVLASRDRYATFRVRRVIIKSRIVKLKGQGLKAARLHLRYIQRDGVTRDGLPGELYDRTREQADGKAFIERADGDRHQFRFIVSAEDAAEYEELRGVVRRLMSRMEEDLGTELDWVAVDHYNTGHPHTHLVVRGKDDRGKDLIIAREYITHGMLERSAEIVTFDLGPRSDFEIEDRLRKEIDQERFTSLDRNLLREVGEDGIVRSGASGRDAFRQTLRAGRLQKVRRLGLAEEIAPGRWKLADELEQTLRRMGERGDIIKTMHREMAAREAARATSDDVIYDPADPQAGTLVGRVLARGLSDEINDRHYLIVDGVDGRAHYVEIGHAEATEPTAEGIIVSIDPKRAEPRQVDHTVAEIAAANGGRYNVEAHLNHDPTATAAFAEAHVRRLEAMRRLAGGIEQEADGTWIIAPDHLDRATDFERMQARASPVVVTTLSALPFDLLAGTEGAPWLDRELARAAPVPSAH